MKYKTINSPLGEITIVSDGKSLTQVHIAGDKFFSTSPLGWSLDDSLPILVRTTRQLEEYFAKKRHTFDLPLRLVGTAFQRRVWQAVASIPYGQTRTYKQIAQSINRPKAYRAVGSAIGRNPACIIIPCHRVVASDGSLGGYVAGVQCKQNLLELEK